MKKFLAVFLGLILTITTNNSWATNTSVLISDIQDNILADPNANEKTKEVYLMQFLEKNNIHNADDWASWIKNNLRYVPDQINRWAMWPETLSKGFGDCEDLSFLTAKVLTLLGDKPMVLGYREPDKGHAFTIFWENGKINIFDNIDYYKTKTTNLKEIAAFLYKKFNMDVLFEITLAPTNFKILFTKVEMAKLLG